MNVFGPTELVEDVQKGGLCIGCGACVGLCPYFLNHKGKTVQIFPCSLTQGRCFAACPKIEVDLDEISRHHWQKPYEGTPMGRFREVLAAKAGAKMDRRRFSGRRHRFGPTRSCLGTGPDQGSGSHGQGRKRAHATHCIQP